MPSAASCIENATSSSTSCPLTACLPQEALEHATAAGEASPGRVTRIQGYRHAKHDESTSLDPHLPYVSAISEKLFCMLLRFIRICMLCCMSMSDEAGPCLVPQYSDVMMGTCRQNSASGTRARARPPEDQDDLWVVQPVKREMGVLQKVGGAETAETVVWGRGSGVGPTGWVVAVGRCKNLHGISDSQERPPLGSVGIRGGKPAARDAGRLRRPLNVRRRHSRRSTSADGLVSHHGG